MTQHEQVNLVTEKARKYERACIITSELTELKRSAGIWLKNKALASAIEKAEIEAINIQENYLTDLIEAELDLKQNSLTA